MTDGFKQNPSVFSLLSAEALGARLTDKSGGFHLVFRIQKRFQSLLQARPIAPSFLMSRLLLEATRTVEASGAPKGTDPSSHRNLRAVDHYAENEAAIPELMSRER